jgi:hypothetical protein
MREISGRRDVINLDDDSCCRLLSEFDRLTVITLVLLCFLFPPLLLSIRLCRSSLITVSIDDASLSFVLVLAVHIFSLFLYYKIER